MIIVDPAGVLTREQPNRMKVAVYATRARRVGAATGRGPALRESLERPRALRPRRRSPSPRRRAR